MKIVGNFLTQPSQSFPHDCELYEGLQENLAIISAIGNVVGDKTILCGCEPENVNTQHTDGYIFLKTADYPNGEILYCEAGSISSGIYLKKETVKVEILDKEYEEAYTIRSLGVGNKGSEKYSWDEFSRLISTPELDKMIQDYIRQAEAKHAELQKHIDDEIAGLNSKYTSLKTETAENLRATKEELEGKLAALESLAGGDIQDLKNYVDKQDGELKTEINTQISGLDSKIQGQLDEMDETLSANYSTLQGKDTQIEGKITTLQTRLQMELLLLKRQPRPVS